MVQLPMLSKLVIAILSFMEPPVEAAAIKALKQKTGARGLRTIIEETLLDIMYEIPSQENVRKCVITKEAIEGKRAPMLVTRNEGGISGKRDSASPLPSAERADADELEESA